MAVHSPYWMHRFPIRLRRGTRAESGSMEARSREDGVVDEVSLGRAKAGAYVEGQ